MQRRSFLQSIIALSGVAIGGATLAGTPFGSAHAQAGNDAKVSLGEATPFSLDGLLAYARELATKEYVAPTRIPQAWIDMNYDQYRSIRFKRPAALWRDTTNPFVMELFAPGLYFPAPIAIAVIKNGMEMPVLFDRNVFTMDENVPDLPDDPTLNYSGFRLHTEINDPDIKDEFVVFQGASYFRAVGKNEAYGLSARGLALNTGEEKGEEFPDFRKFWIEEAEAGAKSVTVHALLDSPSVSGLYTFVITPGISTEMDVTARIFPRTELDHVGIAAETSMFLFDETNRHRFDDFRPAVHDSDGLLIENGAGETLWRQLANPVALQVSSFVDTDPKGFGLMQRPRNLADYADLEANYHRRPGLWVVPGEGWGQGAVTLVEIPADKEIYDNIVAYWRPRKPLAARSEHTYTYRLYWGDTPPVDETLARVINTRIGQRFTGGHVAAIDFYPVDNLPEDLAELTIHVSSNGAKVSPGILQRNPATGGVRLDFTFEHNDMTSVELRAQLVNKGERVSEVWLYRWTQ